MSFLNQNVILSDLYESQFIDGENVQIIKPVSTRDYVKKMCEINRSNERRIRSKNISISIKEGRKSQQS